MSPPEGSALRGLLGEADKNKRCLDTKNEEPLEGKKSLAERLMEFEMWTDGQTFKDLEYCSRRSEKKRRRKERQKHKRWKKLYLPSVLAMVAGFLLTLCGTLQSLGRDSILWDARQVLVVVGPILLGGGFLCLLLTAAFTFEQDDQSADKPDFELPEYLGFNYHDPATVFRSESVDTENLPVPHDLDPNQNYLQFPPGDSLPNTSASGTDSTSSTVFQDNLSSYTSTARWVRTVSIPAGTVSSTLTRQNSDSNIGSATGKYQSHSQPRRPIRPDQTAIHGSKICHVEVHGVCARSLTSSGYYSASDSTTGHAESHLPGTIPPITPANRGSASVGSSNRSRHSYSNAAATTRRSRSLESSSNSTTWSTGQRGSADSVPWHAHPAMYGQKAERVSCPQTCPRFQPAVRRSSTSSSAGSLTGKQKRSVCHRTDKERSTSTQELCRQSRKTTSCPGLGLNSSVSSSAGTLSGGLVNQPLPMDSVVPGKGSVICTAV